MSKLYDLLSAVIAKIAKVADEIPAIDDTLTVKGAAADAAAVGDALDEKAHKTLYVYPTDEAGNSNGNNGMWFPVKIADHTPKEIYEWYQKGGHVVINYWDHLIDIKTCGKDCSTYESISPDQNGFEVLTAKITSDGSILVWKTVEGSTIDMQSGEKGKVPRLKSTNIYGYPSTWEYIDALEQPYTASVGQTIVVKAVDGGGKPTEWKAVDLPKSAAVADAAGDTPTAEEFNALLAALRSAGLMAAE